MTINPAVITAAIESAPAWALLGLTMPSERLREDALREVAGHVHRALTSEEKQLPLPLA